MEIPDYVMSALISGIITGVIPVVCSYLALRDRIVKLETKMEPFWKSLENGYSKAVTGNPEPQNRGKELVKKHEAGTLSYEEAKELKAIAEKCFQDAKKSNDHAKLTYLTLLIGTLDVVIENLSKKVEEKEKKNLPCSKRS